jgi:hypothetical protein
LKAFDQIDEIVKKKPIQDKINNLLYEEKKDDGLTLTEPRLLTIIIKKDKEHYFNFLRDETEFKVKGVWQDTTHHKLFKEPNAEIQIQYLDNREGTVTKKLNDMFKEYNKDYVKEEVLYVTSTPLESTSLNLGAGRT